MFRTLVWFIYFWLYQLWAYPKLRKADRLLAEGKIKERDALINDYAPKWAKSLIRLAGCEVTVVGQENVPKDQAVVFVGNHQGNFDIPLIMGYIDHPKAFIAKDSIEKMPLVSRWMKHMNCVFMNRDNLRQSAESIVKGTKYVKEGYSMVIFPEGTRSLDGELLEFKPGALKLATKAKAPIVPFTISGTIRMMNKGSLIIKPAKVTLTLHAPILPESYEGVDTIELTNQIEALIKTAL